MPGVMDSPLVPGSMTREKVDAEFDHGRVGNK